MTNFFCNGGDGLTTGYWAIAPWKRATSYPNGSYVRQRGGQITIGIALDFTHSKIWFKDLTNNGQWNDSATDDPGTNTGGISNTVTGALFPAVTSQNGATLTANFGASSFVGSVPSGFSDVNTANGSAVTWDPSNKATRIALSGGNLVAQSDFDNGALNTNYSVRVTASFNSGLVYWEVTFAWGTSGSLMRTTFNPDAVIGAVNSTFTVTSGTVGADSNGVGWVASTGLVRINNATVTGGTLHTYNAVGTGNERVFKNNGSTITSGATQPSWNLGANATTSDNGGAWTEVTGKNSEGWSACFARMETAQSRMAVGGDTCFVGDNHRQGFGNGSFSLGSTLNNTIFNFISVDHTVSSPGSGNLLAGASFSLYAFTGAITANFHLNGITIAAVGNSLCVPTLGSTGDNEQRYDNCSFTTSGGAGPFIVGGGTKDLYEEFNNCTFSASNSVQILRPGGGKAVFKGGSISTVSSNPVFGGEAGSVGMTMIFDGVDMSGVAGVFISASQNACVQFYLSRCKIPSSTFFQNTGSQNAGYPAIHWYACDTSTDREAHGKQHHAGFQQDNKTVIRTGGATDSVAGFSEKIATTSNATWQFPFDSLPMEVWNGTTGANRTLTLYGIVNAAGIPTSAEIWPEMRYLGSASDLNGSLATGGIANVLASGSNWTADTSSAWDSQVSARQNSHTYAVGDVIKTATNPGRAFFCTASSGNTAGSEPGGYASAVDGGVVTDGSATFRAGYRFSMAITASTPQPQLAGLVSAVVRIAKASTTYHIDAIGASSLT
jgi:hypothetical protein